jgi:hypothetical protein
VTSLERVTARTILLGEVEDAVVRQFCAVFQRETMIAVPAS